MEWLSYSTRNVLLGTSLLGVVGGVAGCFALLRRQSLLGDAISHAALPGVCLAFLLTGGKHTVALLTGAMIAGCVGSLFILVVVRGSRISEDSAIGIVLSVFFGVGIVLLSWIQKAGGNQSGLDRFLFGQAATLMSQDFLVFAGVGAAVLFFVSLFYKEFKILCFDRAFGSSLGYPMRLLEAVLTCLLVVVVVIGLQTVGVVLMVAALVTPAAAARQWTDRLGTMLILAGTIGGASSAVGSLASAVIDVPTGPAIVLASSGVLVLSLLCAPRRGVFWGMLRSHRLAWRVRRENLLKDLYLWGERRGTWAETVTLPVLMGIRGQSGSLVRRTARQLEARGLVEAIDETLRLTSLGLVEAERVVRSHRIWELYLSRRLDLPADHLHRDAEAMEHALTDATVREFEELLGYPTVDPHGRPIPPRRAT